MAYGRIGLWIRGVVSAGFLGAALFSGCTALVRVPGGNIDVSDEGVFIDLLGATVSVTDDRVLINVPCVEVDVHGDAY